jgi:hypothetical protein
MTDSLHEQQLYVEPKSSLGLKLIAAIAAIVVTIAVLVGYAYLRKRHASSAVSPASTAQTAAEPKKLPKAMILVDEALLQGSKTLVGGTVKNTSTERLARVAVELDLKRRKDGLTEKKLIVVEPSQLEPGQEGRYSLELKTQDYGSARLVGLRAGSDSSLIAFTSGAGQKRPLERLESKTIVVDRPSSAKRGEFLNSPDNPARVP